MAFQASASSGAANTMINIMPSISILATTPWRAVGSQMQKSVRPSILAMPNMQQRLRTSFSARRGIASMSNRTSTTAKSTAHQVLNNPFAPRRMSTISPFRPMPPKEPFTKVLGSQRRTLFGGNTSINNLAHMEETANRNPTSATAQNAFYQALLRANMGAIVVERYQNGGFASNAACESAYQKALATLHSGGDSNFGGNALGGQQLNNAQMQAIGQAVAAQSKGGNIAISRGQGTGAGAGAKDSPLYVVVEETIGGVIFKWTKFLLYFALVCYFTLMLISLAVEGLNSFSKKLGGKADNEAKPEHATVRFSDVHGCDEAKEELQELVDFLKSPEEFSTLGGKLPKGVLLVGPPGTGKTLLARAVAGEAGVPFFFMSGSEFDEVYVGVGAKRVRELFANAKSKSPAIVFIDELDAIGGKRNAKDAAYVKQTLNQLLTELDGFEQNSGVIIIAATNFPELLDKALTRPGRFDRNVVVGLPDVRGRMAILKHHMQKVTVGSDVNLETLAIGTPGFSGAELENVINQAAVHASKAKAKAVTMMDFDWAKDKVMMGAEKKSMIISPKEKEMTAYHEAGHALVMMFTKAANPLHKITVMPRGQALGMTTHLPEIDKYSMSMDEYQAMIDVCLGGKIAEELIYGEDKVTSGVASDLQQATAIAYAMVTKFGMSDKLGNVDLDSNHRQLSGETKRLIESEVRRTIEDGRVRATQLLNGKKKELDQLAKALVDYETLNKDEAYKVIRGEKLDRPTMPSGNIKMPESIPSSGGKGVPGITGIPAIPGSKEAGQGDERPQSPSGGVMA